MGQLGHSTRRFTVALLAAGAASLAPAAGAQAFDAHGSAEQAYATGLPPGASATLTDAAGKTVAAQPVDALGGVLFRDVTPGADYRIAANGQSSDPLDVADDSSTPASTASYAQQIPSDGYGYMTMRDGIQLAYSVHPPTDATNAAGVDLPHSPVGGPYPTLIEYAGYGYADPKAPQNGIAAIANLMGFAVVDVNMRGTGCSGGAYDFFEPQQSLDGYDVIQTIANQPWVKGHKVGMFGISYGGISQLFTAATQPPALAAIAPLSVIDATQTTLYPGGILNTGFAVDWALERVHDALPSGPGAGQDYAARQIAGGDATCAANQALHPEAVDLLGKIRANSHYTPAVVDPITPTTFVDKIKVPTFMACQLTDEQVGAHCPTLVAAMTGTDKKWFTFTNGTHVDSLDPDTLTRMYDFLSIYVADQSPAAGAAELRAAAPLIYQSAVGIDGLTLPDDPIQSEPTYEGAKAAFEQLPEVQVLYDNGAGKDPYYPYPGFEQGYATFPPANATARAWYLAADGTMADAPIAERSAARFAYDVKAHPATDFHGDTAAGKNGLWTATPSYDWKQNPAADQASFVSAPLDHDTLVTGAGAVTVWVRANRPNVDLQATLTEIRPDGKETFVQGGWLRANERKLDKAKSTSLAPVLSLRRADVRGIPRKRFVKLLIPMYYEAHAWRKGSRLRVEISAPNGDQPIWSFAEANPAKGATVTIATGGRYRSRLLLPAIPDASIPTPLPACPGLRGEPCRTYVPTANKVLPLR